MPCQHWACFSKLPETLVQKTSKLKQFTSTSYNNQGIFITLWTSPEQEQRFSNAIENLQMPKPKIPHNTSVFLDIGVNLWDEPWQITITLLLASYLQALFSRMIKNTCLTRTTGQ